MSVNTVSKDDEMKPHDKPRQLRKLTGCGCWFVHAVDGEEAARFSSGEDAAAKYSTAIPQDDFDSWCCRGCI